MVALRDLLGHVALDLRVVHLADGTADVRWVASSELSDPTPFLEGGELLLTTGLATAHWQGEWDGYVARLVHARVAALGVGTGLTHGACPSALRAACIRHGLNLLEVPRSVTFVAVSRAAARLLEDSGRRTARTTLRRQRRLIAAAATPGPEPIVAALAATIGAAVAVLDARGRPVVGPVGEVTRALDLPRAAEEVGRLRRGTSSGLTVTPGPPWLVVRPLGAADPADLYLAAGAPAGAGSPCRVTLATAVALLGNAVEAMRQRVEVERSVRSHAVRLVLGGDPVAAHTLLSSLPDQPGVPGRCRVVRAVGSPDQLSEGLLIAESARLLASLRDDELTVPAPPDLLEDAELLADLGGTGLRIGVGSEVPATRAAVSHRNAGHALAEAAVSAPVVHWEQMVNQGVTAMLDRRRAELIARSYLRPLTPTLTATLRAFLHHHGSHAKVAQDLGVHRNTVRSRVARLEALLEASLDDPDTRATAWIALHLVDR